MINVQELRIGIWVQPIIGDPFCIEFINSLRAVDGAVYSIGNHDINEGVGFLKEHLSGIPLTPELLGKCGFERLNENSFRIGNKNMDWAMNLHWGVIGFRTEAAFTRHQIINLHQLQNLYFALTGEDLQVNL